MSWKSILLATLVYFVVTNLFGMAVSGPLLHETFLDPIYEQNEMFWRPELRQDPPDMASLMPMWLAIGFVFSLVVVWLYGVLRSALAGPEWLRGFKFGLCLTALTGILMLAWYGLFALPGAIWLWWGLDSLLTYSIGGVAMGWAVGRWGGVAELDAATG